MAPARTAMKTDLATAPAGSYRGRKAHQNVDEEAKENAQTGCEDDNSEYEDDEPNPSQGTAVQSMIIGSLRDQKKRHVFNKKKVTESYNSTKTELQNNITALFDMHEAEADAAHSAQLKRLADLLAAKATIESQMTAKLTQLRALYDAHSKELTSVVGARIKELKKDDFVGGGLDS